MKIKVRKHEPNYVELEFEGEDISLPNAVRELLLEDSEVEFASCMQEHPQVGSPILTVRTKKKDPVELVRGAIKSIKKDTTDFKTTLKKTKKEKG